ncbi:receptor homology region, transmembrane domain- and RING domain-containing protein 1 [Ricinus communis]|uniref:receptor homology region, transmembrane domain- and RING domain-containing protein 1 n=1 Tax=Ricinus communis TaxID=3988 RepID=UPI000772C569|nr:receptor homology region, transmembrane domain- and RING domain-containing protein 1 [Ricinus communis]|eukprot:XP_015581167.1 receptor homology region, transmembrane domain- and RING domain-containing protein 1 [Ricinus communis]
MREADFGRLLLLLLLILCYFTQLISSTVVLKPYFFSFPDLPAKSAAGLNKSGICGALHVANPLDACSWIRNNGFEMNETEKGVVRFALIERGGCSFEDKIRNVQNGGFTAAIVFDDRDKRNLVYMMMNPEGIKVHAVFVSKIAGEILKEHARGEEGECCIYPSHSDTAWTVLAISFLSLLLILAFIMIAFILPRHWLYWQGTNFHCNSVGVRMLEGFPRFTFPSAHLNRSHSGETCAICLEDYKEGETLKVLPCQHEFHASCVDSWLTKWGTFCPVCKFDMKTKCIFSEIKRGIWLQNQ